MGASWIIELVSTGRRNGKPFRHVQYFITTLRTNPKAILRLVRHRWTIENSWHWTRNTQLGEDAHRYSHRNGVQVLALLRTLALNLLRCNGFRSIRAVPMVVAHDIRRMPAGLASSPQRRDKATFCQPWGTDPKGFTPTSWTQACYRFWMSFKLT